MEVSKLDERPERLIDVVHKQIHTEILGGNLVAGDQLSVPELSRQLGVSRGSVREAVLQLVAEGLAEERPRRGVVVAKIGPDEVRQIHEIREVLEGQAARLAAELRSAELCDQLDAALREQSQAIDSADAGGYADTDSHFHAMLAAACGNPMLGTLIERLHTQMQVALDRVAEAAEHRCLGHDELNAVADAVRAGDGDAAEKAMRAHIRRTRQKVATAQEDNK
ncbi:GntR family transcriptional regulator [Rhodococcus opacus]|uniref:GntR family transcriptional regulator n=1 Tax=Rhodococcus opacus TaxID=37919 RepID=A0A2S8J753_RHOOP|nr:GntR family transcriptional regulator [Rhodococcus opacus]PQP22759.1 GntR family transcriptional regulator [Rhodococcus opacus]